MNTIRQLYFIFVNFCQGLFNWSFLTFPCIYLEVPVNAKKTIFHKSTAHIVDEVSWFFLHLLVKELVNPQDGDAMSENTGFPWQSHVPYLFVNQTTKYIGFTLSHRFSWWEEYSESSGLSRDELGGTAIPHLRQGLKSLTRLQLWKYGQMNLNLTLSILTGYA
jgi:hypothetical protein